MKWSINTQGRAQGVMTCVVLASTALLTMTSGNVSAEEQSITIRGEIAVFDGDTLEIGPMLIRLHGIDAPEKGQRCVTDKGET